GRAGAEGQRHGRDTLTQRPRVAGALDSSTPEAPRRPRPTGALALGSAPALAGLEQLGALLDDIGGVEGDTRAAAEAARVGGVGVAQAAAGLAPAAAHAAE